MENQIEELKKTFTFTSRFKSSLTEDVTHNLYVMFETLGLDKTKRTLKISSQFENSSPLISVISLSTFQITHYKELETALYEYYQKTLSLHITSVGLELSKIYNIRFLPLPLYPLYIKNNISDFINRTAYEIGS